MCGLFLFFFWGGGNNHLRNLVQKYNSINFAEAAKADWITGHSKGSKEYFANGKVYKAQFPGDNISRFVIAWPPVSPAELQSDAVKPLGKDFTSTISKRFSY